MPAKGQGISTTPTPSPPITRQRSQSNASFLDPRLPRRSERITAKRTNTNTAESSSSSRVPVPSRHHHSQSVTSSREPLTVRKSFSVRTTGCTRKQVSTSSLPAAEARLVIPTSSRTSQSRPISAPVCSSPLPSTPSTPSSVPSLSQSEQENDELPRIPRITVTNASPPRHTSPPLSSLLTQKLQSLLLPHTRPTLSLSIMPDNGTSGVSASGAAGAGTGSGLGSSAIAGSSAPVNSIGAAAFPSPSDRKAPKFRGKHVEDFIQEIDCLAAMHSVPSTELPKACVRYMSKRVKQIISDEPVFKCHERPVWRLPQRFHFLF